MPGLAVPLGFEGLEPRLLDFDWFQLGAFAGFMVGGGFRGAGGGFEHVSGEAGARAGDRDRRGRPLAMSWLEKRRNAARSAAGCAKTGRWPLK